MQIRLSDHFTYSRLLRFTLPSVVTMIVASIYSVVDGLFAILWELWHFPQLTLHSRSP